MERLNEPLKATRAGGWIDQGGRVSADSLTSGCNLLRPSCPIESSPASPFELSIGLAGL